MLFSFGRMRKATFVELRKGEWEKPQFDKALEAIKTVSTDVTLKNTGGLTVAPNGTVKFDKSAAKHHNNICVLLIFVSTRHLIGDKSFL